MTRTRFIVPNIFTGLNFLIGIFSILVMMEALAGVAPDSPGPIITLFRTGREPIVLAGWMIIWGALFDKLDGFAAKVLRASSDFGAQFDSLADMVAFGIAPALLIYGYMKGLHPEWFSNHRPLLIISIAFYMLCTALRLARYNAIDMGELTNYFQGLPSTFAGATVALCTVLFSKYYPVGADPQWLALLPAILIAFGMLMVSPFYFPKLVRRRSKMLNLLQTLSILFGYIFGFAMLFPEYLLTLLLLYASVGFTYGYIKKGVIAGAEESTASASD